MKVAFGVREQSTAIAALALLMVTQIFGVVIFSGKTQAVGTVSYVGSVTAGFDGALDSPRGIAFAPDGTYYIAADSKIHKYDSDGTPLASWGAPGGSVRAIAVSFEGALYSVNATTVARLDISDGSVDIQWGSSGSGDSEFNLATGITVDTSGNVYVADSQNKRIQKFDADGAFLLKWGTNGGGNGQFYFPESVVADTYGNIYVHDQTSGYIQKFTSTGGYVSKWLSSTGFGGVGVDPSGRVYSASVASSQVYKYAADGTTITSWGSAGSGSSQFNFSGGWGVARMATDKQGHVYVVDSGNNRVQIFDDNSFDLRLTTQAPVSTSTVGASVKLSSSDTAGLSTPVYSFDYGTTLSYGSNVTATTSANWGNGSTALFASGLAVADYGGVRDSQGSFYTVGSFDCKVYKYSASNSFSYNLGTGCAGNNTGPDFSFFVNSLAIDSNDNVYVAEQTNSQYVKKFNSSGTYLGYIDAGADVASDGVQSMAIDNQDNLYVGTYNNPRIIKFNSSGTQTAEWGSSGSGDGQFSSARVTVAVDSAGNVYARNGSGSNRVQKFSSDGTYQSQWSLPSNLFHLYVDDNNVVYAPTTSYSIAMYTTTGTSKGSFTIGSIAGASGILGVDEQTGTIEIVGSQSTGSFTEYARLEAADITGLTCETLYHYRAKAVANGDTVYGADQTLTTGDCLTIITSTLPNGTIASVYSQSISTDRGDVTISLSSGTLPPGLSLANSGAITGTPTTAGTYNFVALATDNVTSETDTQALSIVVAAAPPDPFAITTTSLPDGQVDAGYQESIETDSDSPVAFSLQSGTLPNGLVLDPDGMILGTPTTAGEYSFTLEGDNGATTDTQAYTITIADVEEVIDPNVDPEEEIDPEFPEEELDEPEITDVTPQADVTEVPDASSPIRSPQAVVAAQNNLFALAKRIPEPFALGFPWLLLLLALILISIQYYQVHSESVATKRVQAGVARQKQLVEEQNNFVALTTHYLHTPLTVMEGEISLMVKAGTLSQAQATKLKATLSSLNNQAEAVLAQEEHDEPSN